ncbi:unnamed protein product [Prorocentrum cordatum]|uniref:Transposase Tc1-like domain-containing protein n=1 Tax=Prorocentrum cordatum TaxID=2364126 RepID=A0ABN9SUT4_9DINO|nr:unnamed protein product [Polarella glacialis]
MVDKLVCTIEQMTKVADSKYPVTLNMAMTALKMKCCERTARRALHARGVRFHPMREKPRAWPIKVRADADVKDRLAFAKAHSSKPASYWASKIHAYMDNVCFPTFPTASARVYAAKRAARGSYRSKGSGLAKGHVKPRNGNMSSFGKNVNVAVALSAKKVLTCHVVDGRWNAGAAARMYREGLAPALRKACPKQQSFLILEDNDPTGYKAKISIEAKARLRLSNWRPRGGSAPRGAAGEVKCLKFPKRSPDLNPLDYGFWPIVNKRLRAQEPKFPPSKRESRAAFIQRLKRTIMRTPSATLEPLVKSTKRRCGALRTAKGADFEE